MLGHTSPREIYVLFAASPLLTVTIQYNTKPALCSQLQEAFHTLAATIAFTGILSMQKLASSNFGTT